MKIIKTAKLKITSHNKIFNDTLFIYRSALTFYIKLCEKEFNNFKDFDIQLKKRDYIEQISHRTKNRTNIKLEYDFSIDFYKFPSFLRRSVIMEAIGIIESHYSRFDNWKKKQLKAKEKNKKFYTKPPKLNYEPISYPVLYKKNMYINKDVKTGKSQIKIYKNKDWIWIDIQYSMKNLYSSKKFRFKNYKILSPNLIKKGKKYYLHISFEVNVKLPKEKKELDKNYRITSVDLGFNNSAVCVCMKKDGTIIDRLFINQSKEKDLLYTKVKKRNKLRRIKFLRNNQTPNKSRKINNMKKFIIQDTVDKIIKFSIKNGSKTIVFEHLGKMKGKNKTMKMFHSYWNKNEIQNRTKDIAHSHGMRFSRVLARGTSSLAYDGSGELHRNSKGDIAIFRNGKQYHSDLSASYNIGARYFIRNIFKSLPEKARLIIQAKVPELSDRSRHTLSSLIRLQEV